MSYFKKLINETLTETIQEVDPNSIGLPYIAYGDNHMGEVKMKSLYEIVEGYGFHKKTMEALIEAMAKSDCPFVQKFREAVADAYSYEWADDLEQFAESENEGHCTSCDGTGEGQYDGTRCHSCNGHGTTSSSDGEE